MAYAINIRSDSESAAAITELWQQARKLEDNPSMERLAYPPHLTLAVYDVLDVDFARHVPEAAFESLGVQRLRFSSLGMFEAQDSCSLATAVPLTRRAEALEFVRRGVKPIEVQFDVADLVSFHPVEILFDKPLARHA